jgi:FAD/FMN-containing dehydrogenase
LGVQVQLLAEVAARHHVPLVALGGGTAPDPDESGTEVGTILRDAKKGGILIRFDLMRRTRLPADFEEAWAEVEPGALWLELDNDLRARGRGPAVYPTSAPRSTIGGWLAENGLGIGSYEYGWLLENVLWVEVVLAGGKRDHIEGEALRHFVGSRGTMGFFVRARLATRRAAEDVPIGAVFRDAENLGNAVLDLYRGGVPFWHLGFLNASMARAGSLEEGHVLIGAYPQERASWVEPALKRASESHRGRVLAHEEAYRIWEQRFFPVTPLGPTATPGRAFLRRAAPRVGDV